MLRNRFYFINIIFEPIDLLNLVLPVLSQYTASLNC